MSFEQKEWKNRLSENPTRRTLTPIDGGTAMTVDVTRAEGTVMQQGDPFNADNMNDLERRIAEGIGGGEDIIAPTEQQISANAYVVGDKLIFNGVLYNVISPIAVSNSLVPGVNIQVTTVSELIEVLENELTANGNRLYMDYQNGKYGYNTSANRGADTFFPFKGSPDVVDLGVRGNGTVNLSAYDDFREFIVGVNIFGIPSGLSTSITCNAGGSSSQARSASSSTSPTLSYNQSTGILTISNCSVSCYQDGGNNTGTGTASVSIHLYLVL